MAKVRYTKELLEELLKRDNAEVLGDYSSVNSRTYISFKCNCGKTHEKMFEKAYKNTGLFCKDCTLSNSNTSKNKVTYNKELMDELLKRDKAELIGDYSSVKINRDLSLKFKCNCGETHEKKFRYIKEQAGFFCEPCTLKIATEKAKATFMNNLGVSNPSLSEEVKVKRDATNMERRGVINPFADPEVQEKIIQTNLEKRGVKYATQDPKIIQQRSETNLNTYGFKCALQNEEVKEKTKETLLNIYFVDNISKNEDIKEKKIQTTLNNYGVEHPAQHPEICNKMVETSKRFKEVETPSGKIIKLEGYETYAYNILTKAYNEDEIIHSKSNVPEIWWFDEEGKKHRYFVDFYIPKDNLLIEIKSTRTFEIGINLKKIQSIFKKCLEQGYKMEVWIISPKGELIKKIDKEEDLSLD
jgi:hypothetical protein